MAKNDDPGILPFFRRQSSIAVGAQKAKDCLMGLLAPMILEHLDVQVGSISFAEALDELDFAVDAVIVMNKAADKTNDNHGWGRGNARRCSRRL